MKLILNPEYGLYERGGQAFCDSLQIAEAAFKLIKTEFVKGQTYESLEQLQ